MTLTLEDHDAWDSEPPVADPTPYTERDDWVTAFDFAGGVR